MAKEANIGSDKTLQVAQEGMKPAGCSTLPAVTLISTPVLPVPKGRFRFLLHVENISSCYFGAPTLGGGRRGASSGRRVVGKKAECESRGRVKERMVEPKRGEQRSNEDV